MRFGYLSAFQPLRDVAGMANVLGAVGKPDSLEGVDLFVLFGGADISPWFYKEHPVMAQASSIPSRRDQEEAMYFREALERGLPVLGICRGAQFACCLLGGKLWQHVDNHDNGGDHDVIVDGKVYSTNSYHHQMMIPTEEMEILGYTPCLSPIKHSMKLVKDEGDEAEIVLHRSKKVLMIQGHPEWCAEEHDLFKLTHELVRKHLWQQ